MLGRGVFWVCLCKARKWVATIPRHSTVQIAFRSMSDEFGAGMLNPYAIVMRPKTGGSELSEAFLAERSAHEARDLYGPIHARDPPAHSVQSYPCPGFSPRLRLVYFSTATVDC